MLWLIQKCSQQATTPMQFIFNSLKNNLVRLRPASILLYLSLQIVAILTLGLISVNTWTIAQIDRQMYATEYPQTGSIWHIGMSSFGSTMVIAMPILVGATVLVIWRSLRPLEKLAREVAINSYEQRTQADFFLNEVPLEIRPLLQTYTRLVSTISELGSQQQQFIASLSHELRTSLSLISGYLQHISRRNHNLTPSQQESLEIVTTETEHIVQILQDSLELVRIENDRLPFRLQWLSLNEVVHDAVRMTEKFHHHTIRVETNSPQIIIKADRDRLLQVLTYLIDNAIRRCENERSILINLDQKDELTIIQVSDRGCGIAISQISDRPLNLSDVLSQENIDLKLVIIDKLVRRMGGTVLVRSFPGKGSDFWIKLPAKI